MCEQRIFLNAQLVALPTHDVDRIVQDTLDEEVAQLTHQNVSLGKVAQSHWQRTDVIVMTMGDGNRVNLLVFYNIEQRHTAAAFPFRMRARVHQQTMALHVHEPRSRADVAVGIEVDDSHWQESFA